jgi:hypothetical protein
MGPKGVLSGVIRIHPYHPTVFYMYTYGATAAAIYIATGPDYFIFNFGIDHVYNQSQCRK